MHLKDAFALMCLGLMGCVEPDAAPDTVKAQACAPGVAQRVKVVMPPGDDPPWDEPAPENLVDAQGTLYFAVNFRDGRSALWRSDGSDAGTFPVKSFPAVTPRRNRGLGALVPVGSQVFFQVWNPDTGNELWVSDGTEAGTRLVADLMPGAADSSLPLPTALGGALSFFRLNPVAAGTQVELWRSDGTVSGTVQVVNFGVLAALQGQGLRVDNALLFFLAGPGSGTALWRTDGTASGTSFIKRLDAAVVQPGDVRSADSGAPGLFTLFDGPNTEVWKTDGSPAGTVRLDTFGRGMRLLGALGSSVYLTSADDTTRRMGLYRLSLAGGGKATVKVLPNPYAGQEGTTPYLQNTASSLGRLYFSVAIGSPYPGPSALRVGLWVTDGTTANTVQLPVELSISEYYWSPLYATGMGAVLFGGATSATAYNEPWVTRGTAMSTGQAADIAVGGSSPQGFTRVGERVYFSAKDDTFEPQLWSLPADLACPPGPAPE